jgi:predicted nucleic acid-binding protein
MTYLVDTSAWHRAANPLVGQRWSTLLLDDQVSICDQVALEILYSAQSANDYDRTSRNLSGLRSVAITSEHFMRARAVQQQLAHVAGLHHRSVTIADLIIAAVAESAELVVLHYDEDYDRIAAITGQPTEWIAPRGSL